MASITCDVCHNSFEYEKWEDADFIDEKDGTISRPAEELPDGYLIFGKWICQECGSCSECGKTLEKEGNMLENSKDKLCRDCKEVKIMADECIALKKTEKALRENKNESAD